MRRGQPAISRSCLGRLPAFILIGSLCGCHQVLFMDQPGAPTEAGQVLAAFRDRGSDPRAADRPAPPASACPDDGGPGPPRFRTVSTVAAPEAAPRPICLAECIALALENGRTGEFFDR